MGKNAITLYQPKEKLLVEENIYKTNIDGLFYKTFKKFKDNRGFFSELTKIHQVETVLEKEFKIKQVNFSNSITNVVRGMHAENWNKLVTVVSGTAFCVLADIRPNSPTFMNIEYFIFEPADTKEFGSGLIIGAGIANSICALKGPVGYMYGVDALYEERDTSGDKAISIFDPDLNIQWPLKRKDMIISQRDIDSISLRELYPEKF